MQDTQNTIMNKALTTALALGLSAWAWAVTAQDSTIPPRHRRPAGGGQPRGEMKPPLHRPHSPVIAALDANGDGVIDATEIANAATALKSLDANGDGSLTLNEFRPAPAEVRAEQGQGGGPRGPGMNRRGPRAGGPNQEAGPHRGPRQ